MFIACKTAELDLFCDNNLLAILLAILSRAKPLLLTHIPIFVVEVQAKWVSLYRFYEAI